MKNYEITLNLCDEYSILNFDYECLFQECTSDISKAVQGHYSIKGVRIGCETCCRLYRYVKIEKLLEISRFFKSKTIPCQLVFPVVSEDCFSTCEEVLKRCVAENVADSVIVNDFGMMVLAKKLGIKCILGRTFDKRLRDPIVPSEKFLDGKAEEMGILTPVYLDLLKKEQIDTIECEYLELGFAEAFPKQIHEIYVHYPYRYVTSGRICEFAGIGASNADKFKIGNCKMQCMKYIAKTVTPPIRSEIYKHCNAVFEKIVGIDGLNGVLEDTRIKIIYTPDYK